jgi:accessory gene regulator protein AgrB
MRSGLFKLNWLDFGKGLIVAVITAILTFLYEQVVQGGVALDLALLQQVGSVALAALLAYVLKNLFTNSQGKFLKAEPK